MAFVHRVFHEINHPFWGTPIFGNTPLPGCNRGKWRFRLGSPSLKIHNNPGGDSYCEGGQPKISWTYLVYFGLGLWHVQGIHPSLRWIFLLFTLGKTTIKPMVDNIFPLFPSIFPSKSKSLKQFRSWNFGRQFFPWKIGTHGWKMMKVLCFGDGTLPQTNITPENGWLEY